MITNIISNPDFSDGTTGWTLAGVGSGSFSVVSGVAHVSITTQGASTQLFQTGISMEDSTNYRFVCNAWEETNADSMRVDVILNVSPFSPWGWDVFPVALGTTIGNILLNDSTNTAPSGTGGRFRFNLGAYDQNGDEYRFTNIIMAPEAEFILQGMVIA